MSSDVDDDKSGARKLRLRFILESAAIIGLITAVALGSGSTGLVDDLERGIDDIAVSRHTADSEKPHPGVAVVAIDDATIKQLPRRSPIDRRFLADLLEVLDKVRPTAIGVDILFFEPSFDPSDDERLAEVIANMQTPVVLATGLIRDSTEAGLTRRPLIPLFEESSAITALANLPVNTDDRTLRTFRTAYADEAGVLHDTMAAVLARMAGAEVALGTEYVAIDWYGRPGYQDRTLPGGKYAGEPPVATFSALIMKRVPPAAKVLEGKIVLVGVTFAGSADFMRTPFETLDVKENSFAGVFGHAQIVAQLLDGRSRRDVGPEVGRLLVLGAVIFGMVLAYLRIPAAIPLALALLLPIVWILGVFFLRQETGYSVPALPPALGAGLSLGAFALFRARRFDATSRVAAKALNSYLPPALARRVMNDPGLLRLGGEPRELSVLFTDIAGFTSYAQHASPEEVVSLLNDYLHHMADIVIAQNGTLDKFVGDAVMAFFGAPASDPAHSANAISCALAMDSYARGFEKTNCLKTRIGVHTGDVIVGNVGGEQRFDYTVIGDAVNTAARLEGANKYLGTDEDHITTICISGETVFHCRRAAEADGGNAVMQINLTGGEMRARPGATNLRRVGRITV